MLNSPIVIWAITAIFLTLGGTYYARYDRCVERAETIANEYVKLGNEIYHRQRHIFSAVERHDSLDAMRRAIENTPYLYLEFKDRKLEELTWEYQRRRMRVDFSEIRSQIDQVFSNAKPYSAYDIENYSQITLGNWNDTISNDEVAALKEFMMGRHQSIDRLFYLELIAGDRVPNCGFWNVLAGVRSRGRQEVVAISFDD